MEVPDCECCGNTEEKPLVIAKDDDTLFGTCTAFLKGHGCPESAIFLVKKNGDKLIVLNNPDDDGVHVYKAENNNIHAFAKFDAEVRLCCYGLMTEQEDGLWRVGV